MPFTPAVPSAEPDFIPVLVSLLSVIPEEDVIQVIKVLEQILKPTVDVDWIEEGDVAREVQEAWDKLLQRFPCINEAGVELMPLISDIWRKVQCRCSISCCFLREAIIASLNCAKPGCWRRLLAMQPGFNPRADDDRQSPHLFAAPTLRRLVRKAKESLFPTGFQDIMKPVLNTFSRVIVNLSQAILYTHGFIPSQLLNDLERNTKFRFFHEMTSPLSDYGLTARHVIVEHVNLNNIISSIHLRALELCDDDQTPGRVEELSWILHEWMMDVLVGECNDEQADQLHNLATAMSEASEYPWRVGAPAIPRFRFAIALFRPIDFFRASPPELVDVPFVPAGPELDVRNYTSPCTEREGCCAICRADFCEHQEMEVVKLNVCRHIYHAICLNGLINGVEDFSNKCPECRHQICDRRSRRPFIS